MPRVKAHNLNCTINYRILTPHHEIASWQIWNRYVQSCILQRTSQKWLVARYFMKGLEKNMSITNIYEIIDAIITMIMLWIVYVHVYGIEVSVFRKGTLRETMKKPTLFYKLSHIKPGLWITGLCELLTCVTWTEKTEDVQMLLCLFFGQAFFFSQITDIIIARNLA